MSRAVSGGWSSAGIWGGGPDSPLCPRCPLAVWEKCLASSAAVGMEGAGGRGVMLEAGARRCLLTMVPLHVPAKGSLLRMYTGYLKNLERTWLCVGLQKGAVGGPLLFLSCFCGGHGNYCREQILLGYDTRATLSAPCSSRRAALAAGYCAQTNQGASDPSRNSERLGGPGSSSGALCSVLGSPVACPATLGRGPGTGNRACGCYGARALQAPSCTEVGRQEHALVAG